MPKFMGLIRRDEKSVEGLSADESQRVMEEYISWVEQLSGEGKLIDSNPLARSGRVLTRHDETLSVSDGPHTESAEVVGGYITVEAADYEEAAAIFGTHPHLRFGPLELRKIAEVSCSEE